MRIRAPHRKTARSAEKDSGMIDLTYVTQDAWAEPEPLECGPVLAHRDLIICTRGVISPSLSRHSKSGDGFKVVQAQASRQGRQSIGSRGGRSFCGYGTEAEIDQKRGRKGVSEYRRLVGSAERGRGRKMKRTKLVGLG